MASAISLRRSAAFTIASAMVTMSHTARLYEKLWFVHAALSDSTAFEQRLKVDLRIRNPNDADLDVTGMDFRLELNGKRLARGLSNKSFTVPRLGETVSSVETSTSTFDLVRQALGLRTIQEVTYAISGVLHLKSGTLPFDNSGVLVGKGDLSGIVSP